MKLKQPPQRKKGAKPARSKTEKELSSHLADIQLKLDHIIERIKDSLYQQTMDDLEEDRNE